MPIKPKVAGSGSAQPKLIASVNYPDDPDPPTWHDGKRWVSPANVDGETGEGTLNFASVANGLPVWDGHYIHTDQGQMPLWRFFEQHNIPEADQAYLQTQLDAAYDAAMQMPGASEAYVNCCPLWNDRTVTCKPGTNTLPIRDGNLFLRVKHTFRAVAVVVPSIPPSVEASISIDVGDIYYTNLVTAFNDAPYLSTSRQERECSLWPLNYAEILPYVQTATWSGWLLPSKNRDGSVYGVISYNNGGQFVPIDPPNVTGEKRNVTVQDYEDLDNAAWGLCGGANFSRDDGDSFFPDPVETQNPWRLGVYKDAGGNIVFVRTTPSPNYGDDMNGRRFPYPTIKSEYYESIPAWWQGFSDDGETIAGYPIDKDFRDFQLHDYTDFMATLCFKEVAEGTCRGQINVTIKSGNGRGYSASSYPEAVITVLGDWSDAEIKTSPNATVSYDGSCTRFRIPLSDLFTTEPGPDGTTVYKPGETAVVTISSAIQGNAEMSVSAAFHDNDWPPAPPPFTTYEQFPFSS